MKQEIRLAGFGGQGVILAGNILGKAAALYGGKEAVFTQSYGPEARGGACAAELVIADEPIDYPMVSRPDVVVCMSQEAFTKYGVAAAEGAQLLLDTDLVEGAASKDWARNCPFTRFAEEVGNKITANIVMLGFVCGATGVVSREALEGAIKDTVKAKFVDLNMRAFAKGFDHAVTGAKA